MEDLLLKKKRRKILTFQVSENKQIHSNKAKQNNEI